MLPNKLFVQNQTIRQYSCLKQKQHLEKEHHKLKVFQAIKWDVLRSIKAQKQQQQVDLNRARLCKQRWAQLMRGLVLITVIGLRFVE